MTPTARPPRPDPAFRHAIPCNLANGSFMSISQHVLLRYRDTGHLRFDVPRELCEPGAAAALVNGLEAVEGIYRVDLHGRNGKLVIRYLPTVRNFAEVVIHLKAVIQSIESKTPAASASRAVVASAASRTLAERLESAQTAFSHWLRAKLQELRETADAMKIIFRRFTGGNPASGSPQPRWLKEFLNDLVMLYLIKYHWHHITTEWLPRPWTHRYEWAATIYLIYLSVQSRLPRMA